MMTTRSKRAFLRGAAAVAAAAIPAVAIGRPRLKATPSSSPSPPRLSASARSGGTSMQSASIHSRKPSSVS